MTFVEYLPGKANTVLDALSWRDEDFTMALSLSNPTFTLFDEWVSKNSILSLISSEKGRLQTSCSGRLERSKRAMLPGLTKMGGEEKMADAELWSCVGGC
jgi:hypothetical protein